MRVDILKKYKRISAPGTVAEKSSEMATFLFSPTLKPLLHLVNSSITEFAPAVRHALFPKRRYCLKKCVKHKKVDFCNANYKN